MSNVEADRTEPSSDDLNQFVLKRRAAAPKTSIEKVFCKPTLMLFLREVVPYVPQKSFGIIMPQQSRTNIPCACAAELLPFMQRMLI